MRKTPPDILITTPESLYLMLSSGAREILTGVEAVIVDEIHAVAQSKRGSHLALTLERLDQLVRDCVSECEWSGHPARRWVFRREVLAASPRGQCKTPRLADTATAAGGVGPSADRAIRDAAAVGADSWVPGRAEEGLRDR